MEIRAADVEREAEAVGDALARAFHDDPVINWLLGEGKDAALMFATLARYTHEITEVAVDEDGSLAGVALWDPPRHQPDYPEGAIAGFMAAMGDRVSYGMLLDEELGKRRPEQPFWYLAQLGTVPERQGTGVGGALLRAGLARSDAERMPTYLESSKESNVPFYETYGFAVTSRFELPDGPPIWTMWRRPA
ncbi:acetyltransferase (GNAT) family protein [Nonomuraea polychroma]|uniref:Acetyltransferase (GNAT) family protein n=1 Tax=Nonomuraea polychroma TaxID=46176 RepID=A0A438MPM6_9ACTN|nr:GNAT family N-acetyltransferase [Nonomuraea polychroma]RVX47872.1 acetyltransferase (GNAT) family protein [Nonomuraea polychroma]